MADGPALVPSDPTLDAAKSPPPTDPTEEVERRKLWFHECHLRHWNLQSFRDDSRLSGFYSNADGTTLDGLPKWSCEERTQRNAFKEFIGEICDWLSFRRPTQLIDKLSRQKEEFFQNLEDLNREDAGSEFPYRPVWDDNLPHAISRVEMSIRRPWLIGPLYGWSLHDFIRWEKQELQQLYEMPPDEERWWEFKLKSLSERKNATVRFLDNDGRTWKPRIATGGTPETEAAAYAHSEKAKYWLSVVDSHKSRSLAELFVIKQDSDMGLTHIVRMLYLYGSLPNIDAKKITWRQRSFGDAERKTLLSALTIELRRALDDPKQTREGIQQLLKAHADLVSVLTFSAANPTIADPRFSLVAEEVIKQVLLRYKYWLDEEFTSFNDETLHEVRKANGFVRADKEEEDRYKEMQYWSENHYIMFASSEYLIGQLWPNETFQPGREMVPKDDPDRGKMNGEKRKARGKARVLKWLNNRITFGWTEFNCGGYYREHFEPLSNLVDFALDDEVKDKAAMAMDLLLFDIARFTHKGSLGAAGGRVQFKGKRSGRAQAIGDLIEIAFGTRGAFQDTNSAIGAFACTTSYKIPEVLLAIGSNPPTHGFVDRSRVSITFDEAPKYGIGYSLYSRQKRSIEQGYRERLARYSPHVKEVNDAIAASHRNYGQTEDDIVFWWTLSAYFNKQVIEGTISVVPRWGLGKTDIFARISLLFGDVWGPVDNLALAHIGVGAGTTAGAAVGGPIGATVGGIGGAVLGLFAGGQVFNARSMSVWGKVALYGMAANLGPLGIVWAVSELGNPFDLEEYANDISFFTEGSTRTRVNLYTWRSRDAMLSSAQNFRPGQFNLQSNINQATLSGELSAFTTSPYVGLEIPTLYAGLAGTLVGGAGGATISMILNAAVLKGDDLVSLAEHDDGPGWWTGYWALPLVVQHGSAAVVIYDFHWIQRQFSLYDSHLFLPESGLDRFDDNVEPNWDRFDDTDNPLEDVGEFFSDTFGDKNGLWLFGRVTHRTDAQEPAKNEEAYVAVFSNQRWETLDKEDDFYSSRVKAKGKDELESIEDAIENKLDELENEGTVGHVGRQAIDAVLGRIAASIEVGCDFYDNVAKDQVRERLKDGSAMIRKHMDKIVETGALYLKRKVHHKVWDSGMRRDYFGDRDRYTEGKNIWIIQVGSSAEFGSYESFKDRIRNTSIEIDTGDMEVSYDIPGRDGSTTLKVNYEDREFRVGGHNYDIDRYPRFENPFVRGGVVEWGQRVYMLEYQGKSLTHDILRYSNPLRIPNEFFSEADRDKIRALAIYIRTEDEDMDIFSVARATVTMNCDVIVKDDIVAVGEVEDNTNHDVEWIHFDQRHDLAPDMLIEITHPAVAETGNRDPHWRMKFHMKALLGDHRLVDCTVPLHLSKIAEVSGKDEIANYGASKVYKNRVHINFEDDERASGVIPFSVKTDRWRDWIVRHDVRDFKNLTLANAGAGYYPHLHFAAIDGVGNVRIRKLFHCRSLSEKEGWTAVGTEKTLKTSARLAVIEPAPDFMFVFLAADKRLWVISKAPGERWSSHEWKEVPIEIPVLLGLPFKKAVDLPDDALLIVDPQSYATGALAITMQNVDGQFYSGSLQISSRESEWRSLDTPVEYEAAGNQRFSVVDGVILSIDKNNKLWAGGWTYPMSETPEFIWTHLDQGSRFVMAPSVTPRGIGVDAVLRKVLVLSDSGEVWCVDYFHGSPVLEWTRVGVRSDFHADPAAPVRIVTSELHRVHIAVADPSGRIFTNYWTHSAGWETGHDWALLSAYELPAWPSSTPNVPHQEPLARDPGALWLVSRVEGTLELFTEDSNGILWSRWWS